MGSDPMDPMEFATANLESPRSLVGARRFFLCFLCCQFLPLISARQIWYNLLIQPQGSAKAEQGLGSQDPGPYLYEDKCMPKSRPVRSGFLKRSTCS